MTCCARCGGGIPGAQADPQIRRVEAESARLLGDFREGTFEVLLDIQREGAQRRHVHDVGSAGDALAALVGSIQLIDADQEGRKGFARAGGCGDQRVVASGDRRPTLGLGRCRPFGKARGEPGANRGVKAR